MKQPKSRFRLEDLLLKQCDDFSDDYTFLVTENKILSEKIIFM